MRRPGLRPLLLHLLSPALQGLDLTNAPQLPTTPSLFLYLCFLHLLNKPLALDHLSQLCYWGNPNVTVVRWSWAPDHQVVGILEA